MDVVKGQIVVSLLSRESGETAVVDHLGGVSCPSSLPPGWEERRTIHGRLFYVNHTTKTTQWIRPQSQQQLDSGSASPQPPPPSLIR